MNHRQEVILLNLVHFAGSMLAEQYKGRAEYAKFQELLGALAGKEISDTPEGSEHEQGKLPPIVPADKEA